MNRPKIEYDRDDPVEIERARTLEEQGFARVGIPARFWDTLLQDLPFRRCGFGTKKPIPRITPAQQRQQLRQIIVEPHGQLVVLGGASTDEGALAAAASTLIQARREGYVVGVVDAAYLQQRLPKETSVYMIHNVLNHSSDERVEAVRDRLLRWRRPARIVVVGGCQDPYAFCVGRLCLKPDLVGFVQDPA